MQSCVLLNRPFFAVLVVVAVQHYTIVLFWVARSFAFSPGYL